MNAGWEISVWQGKALKALFTRSASPLQALFKPSSGSVRASAQRIRRSQLRD